MLVTSAVKGRGSFVRRVLQIIRVCNPVATILFLKGANEMTKKRYWEQNYELTSTSTTDHPELKERYAWAIQIDGSVKAVPIKELKEPVEPNKIDASTIINIIFGCIPWAVFGLMLIFLR
jgi:hypothetical protein